MVRQIPLCSVFADCCAQCRERQVGVSTVYTVYEGRRTALNLNLSITCIMRPANHATAVKRSTPQALGYRACLFKDRHGLSSPTSHVSWHSMRGPAQQQVIVIYCLRQRCIIFSSTTRYPRYHRHSTLHPTHCIHTLHVCIVTLFLM
jgi:hypothetical protein